MRNKIRYTICADTVLPGFPQVYGPSLKKFAQDLKETPIQERAEFLRNRKEVIESRHEVWGRLIYS